MEGDQIVSEVPEAAQFEKQTEAEIDALLDAQEPVAEAKPVPVEASPAQKEAPAALTAEERFANYARHPCAWLGSRLERAADQVNG